MHLSFFSLLQEKSRCTVSANATLFRVRSLAAVGLNHFLFFDRFCTGHCTMCLGLHQYCNYLCCEFNVLWVLIHLTLSSRKYLWSGRATVELEPIKFASFDCWSSPQMCWSAWVQEGNFDLCSHVSIVPIGACCSAVNLRPFLSGMKALLIFAMVLALDLISNI